MRGFVALNTSVQILLGTSLAVAVQVLLRATLAALGRNKKRTAESLGLTLGRCTPSWGGAELSAPCDAPACWGRRGVPGGRAVERLREG